MTPNSLRYSPFCLLSITILFICLSIPAIKAQSPGCPNADFSSGNFTNWVGYTSIYPFDTPLSNITGSGLNYYYTQGIVPGRHTIITTSTPDPFTCGNVMTLPPNETQCVRLGNGGIGAWGNGVEYQRDFLEFTFSITPFNALLLYKYAVVLQDPSNDPNNPEHPKPIKPRFIVQLKNASGNLIDTLCGLKEDYADTTTVGYRTCTNAAAAALGGTTANGGDIVYRAWTTVGVDLRQYIGQNITLHFETWDCGLGGHFGYAYVLARCDSLSLTTEACSQNGTVKLTAPAGFAYKWFPSGLTSQTIFINNANPGDSVWVEMTTLNGCKTSLGKRIYPVYNTAQFTATPKEVCIGVPIAVKDSSHSLNTFNNSNVPITSWQWNFGDNTGTVSGVSVAPHNYQTAGTYTISLAVVDQKGCKDSTIQIVKVLPGPKADFNFLEACQGKTVTFNDLSVSPPGNSGIINNWQWTFPGGPAQSGTQVMTQVFNTPGTYPVTLQVTTDKGCKDDTTKTIKIWPNPRPNFKATEICEDMVMPFQDLSVSTDPADPIMGWIWDFADQTGYGNSQNPGHLYANSGTYNVHLYVTTGKNCVGDTVIPVVVHPYPVPLFSATPFCMNVPVQFTNLSTPQNTIAGYSWNFDDNGGTAGSTQQNPTHLYDTSKIYNPILTVYSAFGCSASVSLPINIPPLPEAAIESNKKEGCSPLCVKFLDLSYSAIDSIKKWHWVFGDGGESNEREPYYCYKKPGVYTVSLEIETKNTCPSKFTWNSMIKVYPHPVAAFAASPDETTETESTITFTDQSVGASNWVWNYGDGFVNFARDSTHHYTSVGTYIIWQHVKNIHGCHDSTYRKIVISPEWAYYIPNAFTPNGDGKNDGFIGAGFNYSDFEMWIFDRWGNKIYYTTDDKQPWNGKVENGLNGEKVAQQDVYVYKIKLKDIFGARHNYVGRFSLIR